MSNTAPYFAAISIVCVMSLYFGSVMHLARRDQRLRAAAAKLIETAQHGGELPGEAVFRKSRSSVLLFLLLFSLILCADLAGFWFGVFTNAAAGTVALIALPALAMAVSQWKYTIRLSADVLTVSTFGSRSVRMEEIGDVAVGTGRITSFCMVRLIGGEADIKVPSDLIGFLEFVKRLSENVRRAKSGK